MSTTYPIKSEENLEKFKEYYLLNFPTNKTDANA